MPPLFQARCDRCSYASNVFPDAYGAVFVDEPPADRFGSVVAGAVLHGEARDAGFVEQPDPRLVVLAHPLESYILAGTGYTWTSLAWAGRYVWVRTMVCRDCGALFEIRRLACPAALGCQPGCVAGLVVGVAVGVWESSFCLGFFAAYGVVLGFMAVAGAVGAVYTRLRFRDRARELDGPRCCPRCNSDRFGREGVFPCPQCSEWSVRIHPAGIS